MSAQLQEALRALARARRQRDETAAELRTRRALFDELNATLIENARHDAANAVDAENVVRALAVVAFENSRSAKPAPGVEIKQFKTYRYDEGEAFAWAKRANVAVIPEQLDRKAFEKIAAASALDFVTVETEPRVQIATDLDRWFAAAADAEARIIDAAVDVVTNGSNGGPF